MNPRICLAVLAFALALPAGADTILGVLVDPPNPTTQDRIRLTVVGTQNPFCPWGWEGGVKDPAGSNIGISATYPDCVTPPNVTEEFRKTFEIDRLDLPGTYTVYVRVNGDPEPVLFEVFDVREPSSMLILGEFETQRFGAIVQWKNPHSSNPGEGFGYANRLADDSGAFWFFAPDNLEATVKVLDGRPVNGHWWVFIASMTDVEMKVTVFKEVDNCLLYPHYPPPCPVKVYVQKGLENRNFIDVNAFEEKP